MSDHERVSEIVAYFLAGAILLVLAWIGIANVVWQVRTHTDFTHHFQDAMLFHQLPQYQAIP